MPGFQGTGYDVSLGQNGTMDPLQQLFRASFVGVDKGPMVSQVCSCSQPFQVKGGAGTTLRQALLFELRKSFDCGAKFWHQVCTILKVPSKHLVCDGYAPERRPKQKWFGNDPILKSRQLVMEKGYLRPHLPRSV